MSTKPKAVKKTPTTPNPNALVKAARININRIFAERLKPAHCVFKDDTVEPETGVRFVSDGREQNIPCTLEAYHRVAGTPPPANLPQGAIYKRTGLEHNLSAEFFIIQDKKTGKVIDVDSIPMYVGERGLVPTHLEKVETITIKVTPATGGLAVLEVMPKFSKAALRTVLEKLDAIEEIYPGLVIGSCVVDSVSGNTIKLTGNP